MDYIIYICMYVCLYGHKLTRGLVLCSAVRVVYIFLELLYILIIILHEG